MSQSDHPKKIYRSPTNRHTLRLFGDVGGEEARPLLLISLLSDVTCKTEHKLL